jgi:hypothetical protein
MYGISILAKKSGPTDADGVARADACTIVRKKSSHEKTLK